MKEKIGLHFGAMASPLKEQLAGIPIKKDHLAICQRAADSICFLYLHGLLPDGERKKACRRVLKLVEYYVKVDSPPVTPA